MTPRGWFVLSTVGLLTAAAALGGEHLRAQRGFGFGPPDREKRSVVGQFDAGGNGRLNDAERAEARTWLATQPQRGSSPGRRGFGPPPGWRTLGPLASTYRALIATHVLVDTKKRYTFEVFEAASGSGNESVKAFADSRRTFLLGEKQ